MNITYLSRVDHMSCYSYEYTDDAGNNVAGSCDLDDIKNHATTSRGDFPTPAEQAVLQDAIAKL